MNPFENMLKSQGNGLSQGNPFASLLKRPKTFKYDVPSTKKKPSIEQLKLEANKASQEAKKANSVGGFLGNFGKAFVENIAPSEVGLGKTISQLSNKPRQSYLDALLSTQKQQGDLIIKIREMEKSGKDATKLKQLYNENVDTITELQSQLGEVNNLPSTGKVSGQLAGTALDILTAGTYGKVATSMKSGLLSSKSSSIVSKLGASAGLPELSQIAKQKSVGILSRQGVRNILTGTGIGYASDVSMGLQGLRGEDRTGGSAFIPGLGTAVGFGLPAISETANTIKNKNEIVGNLKEKAINKLENKYIEWSSGTKPGKKAVVKAEQKTTMLNKAGTTGKTPMRILAESGITPKTTGTKFNTYEQADDFRKGINVLSDTNKKALNEVGLSTVPSKLDNLEAKAISFARTPENINSGRADKMAREIKNEFKILRKEYPSGNIPITLQDDIKSARWQNVFKNKGLIDSDILKKDSEYAIAKAFQKNIEEVAEKAGHTEVAQLNREIGDRLEASKFLESLDGKTLKGGRVAKYVGTLIGSTIGQSLPAKIIGALGGNAVADVLIKSSVNSPARRIILNKLKIKDPEAYTATIKWLTKQDSLRSTRLQLPAGIPKENPIITPDPRQYNPDGSLKVSSPSITQAKKNPVTVNPKTGKLQTSYSSQSKSPTAQQTKKAIKIESKNPIYSKSSPKSPTKSIDDTLITEARKYKSAEEFVKAQGKEIYHATDSEPFDVFDISKAKKGETYFNPLGTGQYLSSNKEFVRKFGTNTMEYVLPKNAKTKIVTIDNWAKKDYPIIVKDTLKKLGIKYDNLTLDEKVMLNRQVPDAPIISLNNAEVIIGDIAERFGKKGDIQKIMEQVSDSRNANYDAIIFRDTDSAFNVDEILIPKPSKIKTKSQLEDIWKKANKSNK